MNMFNALFILKNLVMCKNYIPTGPLTYCKTPVEGHQNDQGSGVALPQLLYTVLGTKI